MTHPENVKPKPSFGWKKSNKLQSTLKVFSDEPVEFGTTNVKSDVESSKYAKKSRR